MSYICRLRLPCFNRLHYCVLSYNAHYTRQMRLFSLCDTSSNIKKHIGLDGVYKRTGIATRASHDKSKSLTSFTNDAFIDSKEPNKEILNVPEVKLMTFGKHKGKALHEIPKDYYEWLQNEVFRKGKHPDLFESFRKIHNHQPHNDNKILKQQISISEKVDIVYTDGACKNNQKGQLAIAGFGAWFGPGDVRNISGRLAGTKQTNQRAEMTAILKVLEYYNNLDAENEKLNRNILIRTDSRYSINGINLWMHNWKKNKWIKKDGKTVLNVDLWEKIDFCLSDLKRNGYTIGLEWVKGHSGDIGNEAADKLAVAGSLMASSEYPTSTIKKNDNMNDSTSIIKKNDNSVFDIYDDNDVQSIIDLVKPHLQYTKTRSYGKRKIVLHIGPTNSGKTYEAVQSLQNAKSGIYCGPLRLLANEMYEKLNSLDIPCMFYFFFKF